MAVIAVMVIFNNCSRNQEAEFSKLSEAFVEWYFKSHPVTATQLGYHEFDSEFGHYGKEAIGERLADLKRFNIEMTQIDPANLSQDNRIDYEILSHAIEEMIFNISRLRSFEWNPRLVPIIVGDGIFSLTDREFAPMADRVESLVSRLEQIPHVVKEIRNQIHAAPPVYVETAISQTEGLIQSLRELPLEIYTSNEVFDRIEILIRDAVKSLNGYVNWLKSDYIKERPRDFRLGKELYYEKFRFVIPEDITAPELLKRAENSLSDVQNRMFDLSLPAYLLENDEPVWVSRQDTLDVIRWVLDDIAAHHGKRNDVVKTVKTTIDELTRFVEENNIIALDKENPLEIREMPPYMRGVAIAGLDAPGPLETSLKTYYNVSPVPDDWTDAEAESLLREYNDISVRILSIHEAIPGHYVQLSYAAKHPSKLRAIFSSGTMLEGWAHYSEGMMVDAGYGGGDPRYKIVQLKWKLRGIINTIIDQKVHADEMSESEAMKLMMIQGFQEKSEASGKWKRAQLTYCQLSTYYAGMYEMWRLRDDVESSRGTKFDLQAFHQELLSHGSVPIKYLRQYLLGKQ